MIFSHILSCAHIYLFEKYLIVWTKNKRMVYSLIKHGVNLRDTVHSNIWKIILAIRGIIVMIHVVCLF